MALMKRKKGRLISYLGQIADVAFQIGLNVRAVEQIPVMRRARGQGRKAA